MQIWVEVGNSDADFRCVEVSIPSVNFHYVEVGIPSADFHCVKIGIPLVDFQKRQTWKTMPKWIEVGSPIVDFHYVEVDISNANFHCIKVGILDADFVRGFIFFVFYEWSRHFQCRLHCLSSPNSKFWNFKILMFIQCSLLQGFEWSNLDKAAKIRSYPTEF